MRRRDDERLDLQIAGGLTAGRWLMRGNMPTPRPEPLSRPRRPQVVEDDPKPCVSDDCEDEPVP